MRRISDLEEALVFQVRALGIPRPEREFPAITGRKFRFDLAWPEYRLLVEVEGGVYVQGRHTRGSGFEKDAEKSNLAQLEGWTVLHVGPNHVRDGVAATWIEQAIAARRAA